MDRFARIDAAEALQARWNEYQQLENKWLDMPGALCENVPVTDCDCSTCPLRHVCAELETMCNSIREDEKRFLEMAREVKNV